MPAAHCYNERSYSGLDNAMQLVDSLTLSSKTDIQTSTPSSKGYF